MNLQAFTEWHTSLLTAYYNEISEYCFKDHKQAIRNATKLTDSQILLWFTNKRRRTNNNNRIRKEGAPCWHQYRRFHREFKDQKNNSTNL